MCCIFVRDTRIPYSFEFYVFSPVLGFWELVGFRVDFFTNVIRVTTGFLWTAVCPCPAPHSGAFDRSWTSGSLLYLSWAWDQRLACCSLLVEMSMEWPMAAVLPSPAFWLLLMLTWTCDTNPTKMWHKISISLHFILSRSHQTQQESPPGETARGLPPRDTIPGKGYPSPDWGTLDTPQKGHGTRLWGTPERTWDQSGGGGLGTWLGYSSPRPGSEQWKHYLPHPSDAGGNKKNQHTVNLSTNDFCLLPIQKTFKVKRSQGTVLGEMRLFIVGKNNL